jgi:hypothetical protein
MMTKTKLLLTAVLAGACGTEPPDPPDEGKSIFPVAVGNVWTYRIRDSSGDVSSKTQTVTGTDPEGFVFETVRGDVVTTSVQRIDEEERLVRVREESTKVGVLTERLIFTPHDIRVDLDDIELGTTYSQTYLEDHDPIDGTADVEKTQTFTVDSVDDPVTVPAGNYRAIKVVRTTMGGSAKTYWFAKGVGKIKETGGQLEELVSAELVEPVE